MGPEPSLNAVEAMYYHPDVIEAIAVLQASNLDEFDATTTHKQAIDAAVKELAKSRDRLCARMAEMHVCEQAQRQLPTWKDVQAGGEHVINLDLSSALKTEQRHFDEAVEKSDLITLLRRYKLRECGARDQIARTLKFPGFKDYEGAVRQQVRKNQALRNKLQQLLGGLSEATKI